MGWKTILLPMAGVLGVLGFCTDSDAQDLEFEHVMNIGSAGRGPGQFIYVEDFAFDMQGRLLVTDAAHAYVQVFDRKTGRYISRFGGKGDDDAQLEKPEGIAVDDDGNIYVADYTTGYVKKYSKDFEWLKTFSEYGTKPGQNIKSEFMSIHRGLLYLPEAGNHRISVFDLEGQFKFLFGGPGTDEGKLNNPEAAKANSKGEIIVSDLRNNRIQVFSSSGEFLRAWGKQGTEPGRFRAPAGIAMDGNDNIYVAELAGCRIQVFDSEGRFIAMWGSEGKGTGEFKNLHGIIVDRKTGWVYVADTGNKRIQVFRPVKTSSVAD